MSTDDLERKPSSTGGLKKLSKLGGTQPKPATQNLVEQVPDWLQRLLTKYGERGGRLVGLGEGAPEAGEALPPAVGAAPGALTNLLEQMAEEGSPEPSRSQRATSVEWGSYDEAEEPPLDDFLSSLDSAPASRQEPSSTYPPPVEAPDWLNEVIPAAAPDYDQPLDSTLETEAPDWLTEMITPGAEQPRQPATTRFDETPDWLNETLETPAARPPASSLPSGPQTPSSGADEDVPDWLTTALGGPAEAPPPTPAPTPADFNVPDWLSDTPVEPAVPSTFPPASPSPDESSYAVEVPDWLQDIIAPPGEESADEESEATGDVPDWLADIPQPLTAEVPPAPSTPSKAPTWEAAPDWITGEEMNAAETVEAKPGTVAPDTSNWLTQGSDLPSLDWLFQEQPSTPAETEAEAPAQEYADWLFDPAAAPSFDEPSQAAPPQTGHAAHSWLDDLPAQEEESSIPAWLQNMSVETDVPDASFDQPPAWLQNLESETGSVATTPASGQTGPDWLAESDTLPAAPPLAPPSQPASPIKSLKPLKRLSPQPEKPIEPQASPSLPDWAAGLVPANLETGQTSPALPDWAARLVPSEAPVPGASTPALPDWAKALIPPDAVAKTTPPPEPPEKPAPRPLSRLGSLSKPASETPQPAPPAETPAWPVSPPALEPESEPPDWLNDLSSEKSEIPAWLADDDQPTAESPDWLSDLTPAATSETSTGPVEGEQRAAEPADWLSDLSAKAGKTPDWLADLSGPTDEAESATDDWVAAEGLAEEDDLLADRLDWFTQGRPEETSASTPTLPEASSAGLEIPDWLADTPSAPSPATPASPAPLPVEAEQEGLDWLTDWSASEAGQEPVAPSVENGAMADMEIPPWLADLSPMTPVESAAAHEEVEAGQEIPSWLSELPETPVVEQDSQPEATPGLETPSWFTELPEPSTSTPSMPVEAEMERPPWLADLPEEELETPSWMAELPETPLTSTPSRLDAGVESEANEGLETPDWLMDLLESAEPETTAVPPVETGEVEGQPETPPWLAEWPGASIIEEETPPSASEETQTGVEMPSWLAGLGELPEAKTSTPAWEEESAEEIELEAPPWLASLSDGEPEAAEEIEGEAAPWLAELPSLPPAEAAAQVSESELELPSWLNEFPATTETGAPAAETEPEPLELPPWLSDLQSASVSETTETRAEDEKAGAELETSSWLTALPEVAEPDAAPAPWTETREIVEPETPSWLLSGTQQKSPVETADMAEAGADEDMPAWLADLSEESPASAAPLELVETEVEAESETPSWLSELPETPAETEAEIPSWLSNLREAPAVEAMQPDNEPETPSWLLTDIEAESAVEPTHPSVEEAEAELDLPSWFDEIPAPSASEGEAEVPLEIPSWLASPLQTGEVEPEETPSWLSELPEASTVETADEVVAQAPESEAASEIPSWLSELPQAPETEELTVAPIESEAEEPLEIPAWLTGITTAGAVEAAETAEETPSWLADLTGSVEAEPAPAGVTEEAETEAEMPLWSAELPETHEVEAAPEVLAEETEAGTDLEMPAWLKELSPAPTLAEETTEEAVEIPSWLSELPETSSIEIGPAPVTKEAEAETEIPPWLAEIETTPEAEASPSDLTEEAEGEAELKLPSWLREIPVSPTPPSASTEAPETEAEEELPAWLSELPQAPEVEEFSAEPGEAEEALEIPAWLADLGDVSKIEAVPEETETESAVESPAWPADLGAGFTSEEVAAEATSETELEIPSWLTELPQVSESEPAVEASALETPAEEEIPSWLSELPQAPETEELTAAPSEGEAEEPLEIPAWLTGITAAGAVEAAETAEETPSWLADLTGSVEAEPAPAGVTEEPETEAEIPLWSAEPPKVHEVEVAPEVLAEETEAAADLEMPAWLKELPSAPTIPEPAAEPESEELEIPSWLTGIMGAAVAAKVGEPPEAEAEITAEPVELSSLPETEEATEEVEAEEELVMPSWLSQLPPAPTPSAEAAELESGAVEAELESPAWQPEIAEPEIIPAPAVPADEAEGETEAEEVPPWLAELSTEDLKLPSWLSDVPEFAAAATAPAEIDEAEAEDEPLPAPIEQPAEIIVDEAPAAPLPTEEMDETELPPESDWLAGLGAATAAVKAALPAEKADDIFFTSEEEPELPTWLAETPQSARLITETPVSEGAVTGEAEGEPEAPDWLKDLSEGAEPLAAGIIPVETLPPPAEPKTSPTERMTDWLRNLSPSEEALTDEDDKVAESTGVLAGLGPLLPVEKIATPPPMLAPQATASTAQADAMLEAAQHFYAIATQAPRPATLPEPLNQRDRLLGNMVRGVLYLLFIILVALPLAPGLQKVIDPATGQKVPWTEPAGSLSAILDKQRRELVSVQLGAIDLQQPGAVALVSFDYSTATQGEMQPLAEDIIGRLRGQGMRLVFVSLEPEGAALAQRLLDQTLTERGETYGADVVNLGYVPGQMAGIRELVTGRKQLSALPDFKEGLTFAAPERATWSGINNLGQVDILITLSDNPVTARWWIEQMAAAVPPDEGERYLLAATSATADPFLRPYLDSHQLDGLISGINGAAAIEAGRKNFGPARQMVDSQGIAHLLIVILIALGTMAGWMPPVEKKTRTAKAGTEIEAEPQP